MTNHLQSPTRAAVIVDRDLPRGLAANAASVLALTLGQRRPELVDGDLVDADGAVHPGLIGAGLPVLGAHTPALAAVRRDALARDLLVIDFPTQGQETTDYAAFGAAVAATPTAALTYTGVLVFGEAKAVRSVTGGLSLLR